MSIHLSAQTIRRQALFWGISIAVFALFLYIFSSILLPFVVAMALAYFLDPVADRLETWGLSRLWATVVILVVFILVFILALMIIVPVLVAQAADFIERLPTYVTQLQALLTAESQILPAWMNDQIASIKVGFSGALAEGAGFLSKLFQQIWNSGKALVDIASLFVITPVVAFYLLLDWDDMVAKVDSWIPRDNVKTVRELSRKIDDAIAGFVRGQGSLCIILGVFYAISLSLAGLNFGLLIGMFAGLISFIPYVGSLIGLILSVGVAVVQFWPEYGMVALIVVIFAVGQFFEGNILQPKLVGSRIGLHPVWLMFSLLAFAAIFGFVGMLVAVPAAAAVAVLVRFAIERYLDSDLYNGDGHVENRQIGSSDGSDSPQSNTKAKSK